MPWKTVSLLKVRQRLVEAVLARRQTLQVIGRRAGVSRKTADKWRARFRRRGLPGLRDSVASSAPLAHTIVRPLDSDHWSVAQGTSALGRQKNPSPNHVWTVDFKGWFRTADGVRQEPLTVRDLFSRYGLCVRLLPHQDDRPVRRVMERLFREHGVPAAIRVDNGSPFAGKGALGLSRLSVWWMRLGIRVEFTRRARPGDNAGHEQFHGCYQREVVAQGAAHRRAMQQRSTRWLFRYNEERPHEALEGRTPAQVYRPRRRAYPEALAPLKYPRGWEVRRVRNSGHIKWRGRLRFVGRAFVRQTLGLKGAGPRQWEVFLGRQLIGQLHAEDPGGLRPARWLRQTPLRV